MSRQTPVGAGFVVCSLIVYPPNSPTAHAPHRLGHRAIEAAVSFLRRVFADGAEPKPQPPVNPACRPGLLRWSPGPANRSWNLTMTPTGWLLLPIAMTLIGRAIGEIVRDVHGLRKRRSP